MIPYIIRRLLWTVLLLFIVSFITFLMFYVLPSTDPAALRAGRLASPELIASIRETLGLDQPWYTQYYRYMENLVLHFDFGYSYQNNIEVKEEIFRRLPASISLAIGACIVWLTVGISIGILSAIRRGSKRDRIAMGGALIGISAPVYWLGLLGLFLFSRDIGWLPGKEIDLGAFSFTLPDIGFAGAGTYVPFSENPAKWADSLLLPWLVLATAFAAVYARFMRSSLLDVMGEDYVRTARAKGLSERRVVLKHGVRSGITPIVTLLALDLGALLGGALLTETVFNIPGIGRLAFDSIQRSDLPMIQGTVLFAAAAIILLNLLVDIAYAFIDPRVKYS